MSARWDSTGASRGGAVYLVVGPPSGTSSLADAQLHVVAQQEEEQAWRTSTAGDQDGDGLADLWVGACATNVVGWSSGTVYLVNTGQGY